MSDFETQSDFGTAGAEVPAERPTSPLGRTYSDGVGRDAQTDSRRASDVWGTGLSANIMDDRDLDDTGWQCYSDVSTIGNEIRSQGWEKNTVPSGAPPNPLPTSGSRGAADIGKI